MKTNKCDGCDNCNCSTRYKHVGEWLHKEKSTINEGEDIMTFNGIPVNQEQLNNKLQEARNSNLKLTEISPGVWVTKQKLFS